MYECIIHTKGTGILWVAGASRLNTFYIFIETRSITICSLVHVRYSLQITDNGIGKRHLVSLRLKLSKNAF
jgi:hypothetical protein